MSDVTCVITDGACAPLIHSQAAFCCWAEPELPMFQVSPPSGATTVPPAVWVGILTMPYCLLYFQPAAFSSGKIQGRPRSSRPSCAGTAG